MSSPKQVSKCQHGWLVRVRGFDAMMLLLAASFAATGAYRFYAHGHQFGLRDALGCIVGAVGGFFLLMITDYLLHHARLVFYPWAILLAGSAIFEPHLGVGLGLALGFVVASQMRE